MKVIQTDESSCADHRVECWFKSVKNDSVVRFSTNTQFARLRLAHKKGEINIEEVITYQGEVLEIDKHASLNKWPSTFLGECENFIMDILRWDYKDE